RPICDRPQIYQKAYYEAHKAHPDRLADDTFAAAALDYMQLKGGKTTPVDGLIPAARLKVRANKKYLAPLHREHRAEEACRDRPSLGRRARRTDLPRTHGGDYQQAALHADHRRHEPRQASNPVEAP